jgi:hypothetical protein
MLAAAMSYRRWAVEHPVDFQLIFGAPIPGYIDPPDQTGPASKEVFSVFLSILQRAYEVGQLRPLPHYSPDALAPCPANTPLGEFAPLVMYAGIGGWAQMHGVIMLELVGQLKPAMLDSERFYQGQMITYVEMIGLADSI